MRGQRVPRVHLGLCWFVCYQAYAPVNGTPTNVLHEETDGRCGGNLFSKYFLEHVINKYPPVATGWNS